MSRADELRAELKVVELEEELVRQKGRNRHDETKYNQTKVDLREARREHRRLRSQRPVEEGAVRPEVIEAKAGVISPGGDS